MHFIHLAALAATVAAAPVPQDDDIMGLSILPTNGTFPSPLPGPVNGTCSPLINRLAIGIRNNVVIQDQESDIVDTIFAMYGTNVTSVPQSQLRMHKRNLVETINKAIMQRLQNQGMVPPGNPVTKGLQKIGQDQIREISLANQLTGRTSRDSQTVKSLETLITGSVRQNYQNLLDATQGCFPSDANVQQSIQAAIRLGLKVTVPAAPLPPVKPPTLPFPGNGTLPLPPVVKPPVLPPPGNGTTPKPPSPPKFPGFPKWPSFPTPSFPKMPTAPKTPTAPPKMPSPWFGLGPITSTRLVPTE